MHKSNQGESKRFSRRDILFGAGKFAAGTAIISVGAMNLVTQAEASTPPPTPWGYTKLDPDKTAALAYEKWYEKYCCSAVASAILDQLREKIGGHYNNLPTDAFAFGHGGIVGWGTLCGTLMGAGIATSFAAGIEGELILNDVIAWYSATSLPLFKSVIPRVIISHSSQSNSPLCHISAGKWMEKEGVAFTSPQRKERCARLAADVARYTVTLLNRWSDGTFEMQNDSQAQNNGIPSQKNCFKCHGIKVPVPKR